MTNCYSKVIFNIQIFYIINGIKFESLKYDHIVCFPNFSEDCTISVPYRTVPYLYRF